MFLFYVDSSALLHIIANIYNNLETYKFTAQPHPKKVLFTTGPQNVKMLCHTWGKIHNLTSIGLPPVQLFRKWICKWMAKIWDFVQQSLNSIDTLCHIQADPLPNMSVITVQALQCTNVQQLQFIQYKKERGPVKDI